jgi:hypothetical protein
MSYIICHVHVPDEAEPEEVLLVAVPRVGEKLRLGNEHISTAYEVRSVEYLGFRSEPEMKDTVQVRLTVDRVPGA